MPTVLKPVPLMEDLKVTILETTLVKPTQLTQTQCMFLSNMDQIVNFTMPTLHFFSPNPDFPPDVVSKRFKMALEKVLVPYDFMAGRQKFNRSTGRLEIDCNAAGAGYVVASSEFSFEEIGQYLVHPNIGYKQLVTDHFDGDQPLCIFQVTSFKCGSFAIGMMTNHILFDGTGAKTFIENLASQAFDERPFAFVPFNDRRILAARSPPRVSFPHPVFIDLGLPAWEGSSPPVFDCRQEELEYRIYQLEPNEINNLKNKAKRTYIDHNDTTTKAPNISSFSVIAALIWKCRALSSSSSSSDKVSKLALCFPVDIRPRLIPPLPATYNGNAVLPVLVPFTYEEIEKGSFPDLVEKIILSSGEMTDEYAKSAFDWLEIHRGVPHGGDYNITSWLKLGLDQVMYPWGRPLYSCPVVNHRKFTCRMFMNARDGVVNALVCLPPEEIYKFDAHFSSITSSLLA